MILVERLKLILFSLLFNSNYFILEVRKSIIYGFIINGYM